MRNPLTILPHKCNYYCNGPIHVIAFMSPGKEHATMEEVQRELDVLTDKRFQVHSIKPAPEVSMHDGMYWTTNDGRPTPEGYIVFVSLRERKEEK